MQEENQQEYLFPEYSLTKILSTPLMELAQLCIETSKNLDQFMQTIHKLHLKINISMESLLEALIQILITNEDYPLAVSHNISILNISMIKHIFSIKSNLENKYFQTHTIFHLMAVAEGCLQNTINQPNIENSHSFQDKCSKIKQYFMRNVKKHPTFWGLSELESLNSYLIDKSTGYFPAFSTIHYATNIARITLFLQFYAQNKFMFPINIEMTSVILKMLLCFRLESQKEKITINELLNKHYFSYEHHNQITSKNLKLMLEFLRNGYNEKECLFSPQKCILWYILPKYKVYELDVMLSQGIVGLYWNKEYVNAIFVNCIKLGITENITKMLMSFLTLFESNKKYQELIFAIQSNISRIFVFMKYKNLFPLSLQIMKKFMLGPFPTISLFNKFIDKAIALISIVEGSHKNQFLRLLQVIQHLYSEMTVTEQLKEIIEKNLSVEKGVDRVSLAEMTKIVKEYEWRLDTSNNNKLNERQDKSLHCSKEYKGLTNIGNSCYMNSFIQALFMNLEFRKEILQLSTLDIEQNMLKTIRQKEIQNIHSTQPNHQNLTTAQQCKVVRETIRPLAEFQRLFSLLLRSQRPEISPSTVKNVSPVQFQNNSQQDSNEFGLSLLDSLHRGGLKNYFRGDQITSIHCENCNKTRDRKQQFIDLTLFTDKEEENLEQLVPHCMKQQIVEDLTCDFCGQKSKDSIKTHQICAFPDYLILTIKRFQYSIEEKKNKKVTTKINFKESIIIYNIEYQIYSIVIHRGASANSGHYFTFSKVNQSQNNYNTNKKKIDQQKHQTALELPKSNNLTFDQNMENKTSEEVQQKQCEEVSTWVCHNDSDVNYFESFEKVNEFLEANPEDTPYIFFLSKRSHYQEIGVELQKRLVLRKALQNYVEKDNMDYLKSLQKTPVLLNSNLNNWKWNYFYKKDEDEEEDPSNNPFNNTFNRFIS